MSVYASRRALSRISCESKTCEAYNTCSACKFVFCDKSSGDVRWPGWCLVFLLDTRGIYLVMLSTLHLLTIIYLVEFVFMKSEAISKMLF